MLTISTRARYTDLTSLAAVKARLVATDPIAVGSDIDGVLGQMIRAASGAIARHCNRTFERETYVETLPGYGSARLMLSRTPIVAVSSVSLNGDPITDYVVDDANAGLLYRDAGWDWTVGVQWGLDARFIPRSESPEFSVTYTAGFFLPGDARISTTLSAAAADKSFNDSAGMLPAVIAGEIIAVSGFANAENNGRFTVVSRTSTKIVVAETLVDEAVGADVRTIDPKTLPSDLEEAAILTVKTWWLGRTRDSSVQSKSVGDLSIVYRPDLPGVERGALQPEVKTLLLPWVRYA